MGLMKGLRSVAKGVLSESARFEAQASRVIDLPMDRAFEAGTMKEVIPEQVGNLTLHFGRAAIGSDRLELGDHIDAEVDLRSLGKLADMLAMRMNSSTGAIVPVPMEITQLEQEAVRLRGIVAGLGNCSIDILLREQEAQTHAEASLGVVITPIDIRAAAETQRTSLEGLLTDSMELFVDQYAANIQEYDASRDGNER